MAERLCHYLETIRTKSLSHLTVWILRSSANAYQAYLTASSADAEPSSFTEDSQDVIWVEVMKEEIKALEDNSTWEVVDLPLEKQHIGSKWVYKIKYKTN